MYYKLRKENSATPILLALNLICVVKSQISLYILKSYKLL